MQELSKRAQTMKQSPLRKLVGVANERKAQGITVHHLNIGQPDLPTPQPFFDVLHSFQDNPVAYANSQGVQEARDAWRGYYKQQGFDIADNELMVTSGGSEALIFAFCAIADPGDNMIVFEPFYTNYNGFGVIGGISMNPVTLSIDNGFHLPEDEAIEAAINDKTRAIVICNPSNPTGTVYTKDEVERILAIAKKHNLYVVADEVYREFAFEQEATSVLEYPEYADRTIVIDSASKRFNACGTRVGVLVSKNTDIIAAAIKFGMARLATATIEQMALIPVLEQAQEIIPSIVDEYRGRRDIVYEGLQAIEGVKCLKPEGALYIIAELPVDSSEQFALWVIQEFEQDGETVLVAPAPGFYATPGKGEQEIRIAYVLEQEKLKRAMELLAVAITTYNSQQ